MTAVFLSGTAKSAFSDENAGFNLGFSEIINSTQSRHTKKGETKISNSFLKQQVNQMAGTADHCHILPQPLGLRLP